MNKGHKPCRYLPKHNGHGISKPLYEVLVNGDSVITDGYYAYSDDNTPIYKLDCGDYFRPDFREVSALETNGNYIQFPINGSFDYHRNKAGKIEDSPLCVAMYPYGSVHLASDHYGRKAVAEAKLMGWVDRSGHSTFLSSKGGRELAKTITTVNVNDPDGYFETFLDSYLTAELWGASLEDGNLTDDEHSVDVPDDFCYDDVDNLHPSSLEKLTADALRFYLSAKFHIERGEFDGPFEGCKWSQAGHDFAMTRNGHGVGFWESEWNNSSGEFDDNGEQVSDWDNEATGKYLTHLSEKYGSTDLSLGDDLKVHSC